MNNLPEDVLWCIKQQLEDKTAFELATKSVTEQTIEFRHLIEACKYDDIYHLAMWVRAKNVRHFPILENCTVKSADWLYRFIKPKINNYAYNISFQKFVMANQLDLLRWFSTKVDHRPGNVSELLTFCLYWDYIDMCRYLLYESCAETCRINSYDIRRYSYNNYQLHKIKYLIETLYLNRYHQHLLQEICDATRFWTPTREYMFETYDVIPRLKPTTN